MWRPAEEKMMSDHDEASSYSDDNPGFEGEYEFGLTVEMLGRRSTPYTRTRQTGSILI